MPAAPGLRERKKQQTREGIVRAALQLFDERGFEATTIADIAAAADIAPRTFFGYFPSKEAVVFHDFEDTFVLFATRLLERPADETAFDALRDWVTRAFAEPGPLHEPHAKRKRLIRATPALQAFDRSNLARFQELLTEAVATDLDVPPDALRAALVASAAVAAIETLSRFGEQQCTDPDPEHVVAVLDEVLVFLSGGLGALRDHPAPHGL